MKTERPLHNDYASLLRMAIPISLGSLVQFFVVLTDNFFLARLNEDAINGAGNAGLVYLTLQMLAVGSSAALQITIAKRLGEGRRDLALSTFRSGLAFHGALGIALMALATILNQGLLGSTISSDSVRNVFEPFLSVRTWGFIPFSLMLAFNALYTGTARTLPILIISGTTAFVNIILDAGWVEGWWGMTAMGAQGAAWASFVAELCGCVMAICMTAWVIKDAYRPWIWLQRSNLIALWKLAYPLMAQFIVTVGTWTAFFFFVEKVGGMELKVSHVARNLFMLGFVVAQGMQQTTRTYVSGMIGEGRSAELKVTLRRIVLLNFGGILLLCHGFILYPETLASMFFDDGEGFHAMTRTFKVVFVAVLLESLSGVFLSTIQGMGSTVQAFWVELVTVTLYLIVAASMTLWWPQPIWVIWRVEWVYFSCIGLGSWWFLRRATWMNPKNG